jgi:endonuclease G
MRIVITHGRDQAYQIPDTMQREWTDALRYGLRRVKFDAADSIDVQFAFYGDIWRGDYPGRAGAENGEVDVDRGAGAAPEVDVDRALAAPASDIERGVAADLAGAGDGGDVDRFGWDDLASIIDTLDARFGVGKIVLTWFLKDLDEYLSKDAIRADVKARLTDKLSDSGEDAVLLAHSMGSIVGYDLLADGVAGKLRVGALLTFGSPLGMPTLHSRMDLLHPGTPFPDRLPTWVNVYNRKDFATTRRTLKELYGPTSDLEDVEAIGQNPGLTTPGQGHDPKVYLSSIGLATALRRLLERPPGR